MVAKADDLCIDKTLWTAMDATQCADRYGKIGGGDGRSAQPSHSASQSDGDDFRDSIRECEHSCAE